jgi:predicted metal-dependent peptidase
MSIHPKALAYWVQGSTDAGDCPICGGVHSPYAQLAAAIVHEGLHPLMKHFDRSKKFKSCWSKEIANYAMDLEINMMQRARFTSKHRIYNGKSVKMADICLGKQALYADTFAGGKYNLKVDSTYEEYYVELLKKMQKDKKLKFVGLDCDGGEKCAPEGKGDMSDTEIELVRHGVAKKIRDAKQKGRGDIPESLSKWADEMLAPPKLDWRTELKKMVGFYYTRTNPGNRQRSYHKLSVASYILKKAMGKTIPLPTYIDPSPAVGVVLDTSGSMDNAWVKQGQSEIEGICKTVSSKVYVVSVDCSASKVKAVRKASQADYQGGGGTDMRVGISALLKEKNPPNVIVVITDCDTPWPAEPIRNTTLIVAAIGPYATQDKVPSWAKYLKIED